MENQNISNKVKDLLKRKKIILIEDNTHCINSVSEMQSDIEIYSPHKLFAIENGSIIKFKSNKLFKNFISFYKKDNKKINNKLKNFFKFFIFILKKEIRRFTGYRYPKLNFESTNSNPIRKNHHIGIFSNLLLWVIIKI